MSRKKLRICVFSLFRDSEDYLDRCLKQLEDMEKQTDAKFTYFFYENDSKDNTVSILNNWIKARKGKLLSEKLGTKKFGSIGNRERMVNLSSYRNKMVKLSEGIDSEYSIIFDSDVIFKGNIVNQFLEHKDLNFSMLTPNIRQNIPCKMGSKSKTSYYDSSILFDIDGQPSMTWSDNPFYNDGDRKKFKSGQPIKVKSSFGSFALVKSEYLKHCRWNSMGESEHLSFCHSLNKFAPIYLLPKIKPKVIIEKTEFDHSDNVVNNQKFLSKNKWNRFLLKTRSL